MPVSSLAKPMRKNLLIKATAICCDDLDRLAEFGLQGFQTDKKLLPVALRRRTGMTTRMAVTAAFHACDIAAVDSRQVSSVFASVGGEIQVTDSLCSTLPDKQAWLSPTQFHNSVHNTTAGYWSIINGCQAPSTAIAAVDDTFAMGLLEAWSQLQQNPGDVLLVCYDELWPQYLAPPMGKACFACALVLSNQSEYATGSSISMPKITQHKTPFSTSLYEYIQAAPAAAAIPLLQALKSNTANAPVALNIGDIPWQTQLYVECKV